MSVGRAICVAFAMLLPVTACGDDSSSDTVRVGEIGPAVAAVEAMLGGPQHYSEVNATPSEVNVFVVRNGEESAYVVRNGEIEPPPAGVANTAGTFDAADMTFTPAVLDKVASALPDSEVVAFSVTPGQSGAVEYIATVRAKGGELRVLLDAAGNVLAVA